MKLRIVTIALVFLLTMAGSSAVGQYIYWQAAGGASAEQVAQLPSVDGQVASATFRTDVGLLRPGAHAHP